MKQRNPQSRRAAAVLLPAAALIATPLLAQEAAPPPVPAPAQSTPPAATQVAPPPVVRTQPEAAAPAPSTSATADPASKTVIAPEATQVRDEARERPAASTATRPSPAPARARATAPAAAAPVAAAPAAAPAPVTAAPEPAPTMPVTEAAPAPATEPTTTTETTTQIDEDAPQGAPIWPIFALIGVAIAAIFGLLAFRRRRETQQAAYEEYTAYAEPAAVEPAPARAAMPVVEPAPVAPEVAAAPAVAAGHAISGERAYGMTAPVLPKRRPAAAPAQANGALVDPIAPAAVAAPVRDTDDAMPTPTPAEGETHVRSADANDVAALASAEPVADRPWLEFAMRPVRAGTSPDEALVDVELTVANTGKLPAEDVRIATFMLPAGAESEIERLLIEGGDVSHAQATTLNPGQGTAVDASMAMAKAEFAEDPRRGTFTPVVVADARYRLPDGSEGRTAAAFKVGMRDESGTLRAFPIGSANVREDVDAELHGQPQRA